MHIPINSRWAATRAGPAQGRQRKPEAFRNPDPSTTAVEWSGQQAAQRNSLELYPKKRHTGKQEWRQSKRGWVTWNQQMWIGPSIRPLPYADINVSHDLVPLLSSSAHTVGSHHTSTSSHPLRALRSAPCHVCDGQGGSGRKDVYNEGYRIVGCSRRYQRHHSIHTDVVNGSAFVRSREQHQTAKANAMSW